MAMVFELRPRYRGGSKMAALYFGYAKRIAELGESSELSGLARIEEGEAIRPRYSGRGTRRMASTKEDDDHEED